MQRDASPARVHWITVEGPIGVGKSTLIDLLIEEMRDRGLRVHHVPENVSRFIESGLFQDFQRDPARYAYHIQTMFFHRRTADFLDVYNDIDTDEGDVFVVSERSIISDGIFMRVQHRMGNCTDREMDDYADLHCMWRDIYPIQPGLVLHCQASPQTCQARVHERHRDAEEDLVDEDYNAILIEEHARALVSGSVGHDELRPIACPVERVDAGTNFRDDPAERQRVLDAIIDGHLERHFGPWQSSNK